MLRRASAYPAATTVVPSATESLQWIRILQLCASYGTHALQQMPRISIRCKIPSWFYLGSRSPLLGGGGGGGLSPAGKLGDRNVDAASDSGRSERKIDLAIKLIRKKIANDLHSIARPVWSLDGGATAFLPFDA